MSPRVAVELQRLFGTAMVIEAERTDPATLELSAALMDQVADAADTLLTLRGNVGAQRQYVEALEAGPQLVLCMWLMDTGLAAKLIQAACEAA